MGAHPVEVLAPIAVEQFDEYAIVGKLGHGGMAEVFLALSTGPSGFRKLLVIKRVHPHLGEDPSLVTMFLDEARLAARLNHPHVVQTYKVGAVGGRPFMAMEYLDGQACNRLLKRCADAGRALPHTMTARIVADVLDGLDYAHHAVDFDGTPLAIVHRDISPHNVFVGYDGSVKVLDFGIAKAATSESQTRTGTIKGKFAYIAPEQARGEAIDGRADVWSTGVSMWEMLTGRRLFRRSSDVAVLQATLSEAIPRADIVDPSVPSGLADICERALQRDLGQRWANARLMKEALDEWLAANGRGASRSALGALMKELFPAEIEDQRAAIKACVSRVQSATGSYPSVSAMLPLAAPPSGEEAISASTRIERKGSRPQPRPEGLVPGANAEPAAPSPSRTSGVVIGAVAVLVLGLVAGGAFVLGRGDTSETPMVAAPPIAPSPVVAPVAPSAAPPSTAPPSMAPTEPVVATPTTPAPTTDEAAPAVVEAADDGSPADTRGRSRRPRGATSETPAQPPAPTTTTTPDPASAAPAAAATGHLTLDATPYAVVSLEGRRLGITPIDVDLPAGAHVLTLRNPEQGLETTYRVTVRAGESIRRTVALE